MRSPRAERARVDTTSTCLPVVVILTLLVVVGSFARADTVVCWPSQGENVNVASSGENWGGAQNACGDTPSTSAQVGTWQGVSERLYLYALNCPSQLLSSVVPAGSTIDGVQVDTYPDGGNANDVEVQLATGPTTLLGANQAQPGIQWAGGPQSYGSASDMTAGWGIPTGLDRSVATSSGFGLAVRGTQSGQPSLGHFYRARFTITYTPPAGSGTTTTTGAGTGGSTTTTSGTTTASISTTTTTTTTSSSTTGCTPITTCPDPATRCGDVPDGCGSVVTCGGCPQPNDQCSSTTCNCVPDTCATLGASCGNHSDGCGQSITCGDSVGSCVNTALVCSSGKDCVTCPPSQTCAQAGRTCDLFNVSCTSGGGSTTLNCGQCTRPGEVCQSGVCTCPDTCTSTNSECGFPVFCGTAIDCGSCAPGSLCLADNTCFDPTASTTTSSSATTTGVAQQGTSQGTSSGDNGVLVAVIIAGIVALCCCFGLVAFFVGRKNRERGRANDNGLVMTPLQDVDYSLLSPGSPGSRASSGTASPGVGSNYVPISVAGSSGGRSRTDSGVSADDAFSALIDESAKWFVPFSELALQTQIGSGSFGEVYAAEWRGSECAVKILSSDRLNSEADVQEFIAEAQLMAKLRPHTAVVQFLGLAGAMKAEGTDRVLCIISELCVKGSCFGLLQAHQEGEDDDDPVTLKRVVRWAHQAALGVRHLHQEGVIHRDIAARNILISGDDGAKISDFGLSRVLNDGDDQGQTMANVGPIAWMAPESLLSRTYSEASDVHMLGATLFELLTRGGRPYGKTPAHEIATRVGAGTINFLEFVPEDLHSQYDAIGAGGAVEIMEKCVARVASERPDMVVVCEQLGTASKAAGK